MVCAFAWLHQLAEILSYQVALIVRSFLDALLLAECQLDGVRNVNQHPLTAQHKLLKCDELCVDLCNDMLLNAEQW